MKEDIEEDIYSESLGVLLDNDELSSLEAGFMMGYMKEGRGDEDE